MIMNMKSVYRWTAGLFTAAALTLAVNEYRQTDPFANLNPNSPTAPIVRDVFENGKQDGNFKKKNYCFVPQPSGDDYMDAEIQLDKHGYPTGSLKVTTLGPAPMNRRLQDFPDLDGNGDCDSDDPELDKRYEKIVGGIKEDMKYRNLARAVFDYVEMNGDRKTVWKPLFPRLKFLSFLGRNVEQPNSSRTITLRKGTKYQFSVFAHPDSGYGYKKLVIGGDPSFPSPFADPGLLGYNRHDRKTVEYRPRLEQVARELGISFED